MIWRSLLAVLIATATLSAVDLTDGQVLHWRLDDGGGGVAADASGQGNAGTLVGGTTWTTGPLGGALACDGAGGSVSRGAIAGLPGGNAAHSIATWVRVDALPTNRAWILLLGDAGTGADHWLIDRNGTTQFGAWNGGQTAPGLPVGQWHHVATTFDGTVLRCYRDGIEIGSSPATFDLRGSPLTVAQAHIGENAFAGAFDDLRVYARALDAAEVQALAGMGGDQPPVFATPIADQHATLDQEFVFTLPDGTFSDPDGDPLSLSASGLPGWLVFDAETLTFIGTPDTAGSNTITVVATDPSGFGTDGGFTLVVDDDGAGTGLLAQYYGNEGLSDPPLLTRIDPGIDYEWGGGAPAPGLPADSFSVRWSGFLEARRSGPLTLFLRTDDGVRLWLDNQLVINDWVLRAPADSAHTFTAEAGHRYAIRIEYFEHTGGAVAHLDWSEAGGPRTVVPASRLFPATGNPGDGSGTGLRGSYFANEDLAGVPVFERIDPMVDYAWGSGSPAAGFPSDQFSVRWTGSIEAPTTGPLTLILRTDDGVRLWLDGAQVINDWVLRGPGDSAWTFPAQAGHRYAVVIEYFEHFGGADAHLLWLAAGIPRQAIPTARLFPPGPSLTIATAAAAVQSADGFQIDLSVLGADDGGEAALSYSWSLLGSPVGSAVTIGPNDGNDAKTSWARYSSIGTYSFRATITDADGNSVSSDATVAVVPQHVLAPPVISPTSGPYADPVTVTMRDGIITQPFDETRWGSRNGDGLETAQTLILDGLNELAIDLHIAPSGTHRPSSVTARPTWSQPLFIWSLTAERSSLGFADSAWGGSAPGFADGAMGNRVYLLLSHADGDPDRLGIELRAAAAAVDDPAGWSPRSIAIYPALSLANLAQHGLALDLHGDQARIRVGGVPWIGPGTDDAGWITYTGDAASGRPLAPLAGAEFRIQLSADPDDAERDLLVSFIPRPAPQAIRFTSDGTGVTPSSAVYTGPLSLPVPGTVMARVYGDPVFGPSDEASESYESSNQPPVIATGARASESDDGTLIDLSVLGADDAGEASLTYAWSLLSAPAGSTVTIGSTGTNAAKHSLARFSQVGDYAFRVAITDAQGLSATDDATVTVVASRTLADPVISPAAGEYDGPLSVSLAPGTTVTPLTGMTWGAKRGDGTEKAEAVSLDGAISAVRLSTTPTGDAQFPGVSVQPSWGQPGFIWAMRNATASSMTPVVRWGFTDLAWDGNGMDFASGATGNRVYALLTVDPADQGRVEIVLRAAAAGVDDPADGGGGLIATYPESDLAVLAVQGLQLDVDGSRARLRLGLSPLIGGSTDADGWVVYTGDGASGRPTAALAERNFWIGLDGGGDAVARGLEIAPTPRPSAVVIRYTTDGSPVVDTSPVYAAPFPLAVPGTVTAQAGGDDVFLPSEQAVAGYIKPLPAAGFPASGIAIDEGGPAFPRIVLDRAADHDVTVFAAMVGGDLAASAVNGAFPEGPWTIPAGQTEAVLFRSAADDVHELDTTSTWTITEVDGGRIGDMATTTITIHDDDPPPALAFTAGTVAAGQGAGVIQVALALSTFSGAPVTITPILEADAPAVVGSDARLVDGPVVIPASVWAPEVGQQQVLNTTAAIPVEILSSGAAASRTLRLSFSVSGATIAPPSTCVITIDRYRPAPTIATPAQSVRSPDGMSVLLSVRGDDADGGESALTYTWSVVTGPSTGQVTFAANGTNPAQHSAAWSPVVGTYTFRCTVTDADGQSVSSDTTITTQASGTLLPPVITPPGGIFPGGVEVAISADPAETDPTGAAIGVKHPGLGVESAAGLTLDGTVLAAIRLRTAASEDGQFPGLSVRPPWGQPFFIWSLRTTEPSSYPSPASRWGFTDGAWDGNGADFFHGVTGNRVFVQMQGNAGGTAATMQLRAVAAGVDDPWQPEHQLADYGGIALSEAGVQGLQMDFDGERVRVRMGDRALVAATTDADGWVTYTGNAATGRPLAALASANLWIQLDANFDQVGKELVIGGMPRPQPATIRVETGGEPVTEASEAYQDPFGVFTSRVVRARAWREGWSPSPEASAAFIIDRPSFLPASSFTSPVCIEAWDARPDGTPAVVTALHPDGQAQGIFFEPGLSWIDCPLQAGTDTAISLITDSGAILDQGAVSWLPTLLSGVASTNVRVADALLLEAPDGGTLSVSDGCGLVEADRVLAPGELLPYVFPHAGAYSVEIRNGVGAVTGSLSVGVVGVDLHPPIACEIAYQRIKDVDWSDGAEGDVVFQAIDPTRLAVGVEDSSASGARLDLRPLGKGSPGLLARLGSGTGPIIAGSGVEAFRSWSAAAMVVGVVETYPDGSRLVESQLSMEPLIRGLEARLGIYVSGALFDNGSTQLSGPTDDFTDLGTYGVWSYRLLLGPGSKACHNHTFYQNGVQVSP